jgi:hypothetical protein
MIVTREVECSSQPHDAKLSLAPRSGFRGHHRLTT